MWRKVTTLVVIAVIGLAAFWVVTTPAMVPASTLGPYTPDLTNGKTMFYAGGCAGCHATPGQEDKTRLGGGLALKSPFGTFYVPNISADPNDGIGAWSEADFRRAIGFEATIDVRQVTTPQCPAISFLDRLRRERSRAPRLDLDRDKLRSGEVLGGMIDRYGDQNVDLVLVSDAGKVQNLSQLLKPGTDAKTFKIGMQRTDGGGRQPQLLIAIATASPLAALAAGQPVAAEQFFRNVLNEAAQSGRSLSATGGYFMLEGDTGAGASR